MLRGYLAALAWSWTFEPSPEMAQALPRFAGQRSLGVLLVICDQPGWDAPRQTPWQDEGFGERPDLTVPALETAGEDRDEPDGEASPIPRPREE